MFLATMRSQVRHRSRSQQLRQGSHGSPRTVGRSAAMQDAARGEFIARRAADPSVWDQEGAKTLQGLSWPRGLGPIPARARQWLIETLGRRRAGCCSHTLEGQKPKGAASGWRANTVSVRQGLPQGQKPRNRGLPGRPVASAAVATAGETVRGCFPAETRGYLARGESSEG
jgi:hypothetical protein